MPYLIINKNILPSKRRWLNNNAIPLSDGVWLHNTHVTGALCARIGDNTLADMAEEIEAVSKKILAKAEEDIIQGHLRGRAIELLGNRLLMVAELSLSFDTIEYAQDLLIALGKSTGAGSLPDKTATQRANPLGFDRDSVEKYLLSVAKKKPIH
tara:strand:- start:235 stop:696 length:462 start_codon:yes stop_codon:yes gene_type:complete